MSEFKMHFAVKSKGKKENEKEDEIKRTFSVHLTDQDETGVRLLIHSEKPIPLELADELELHSIKHQKTLKEAKE